MTGSSPRLVNSVILIFAAFMALVPTEAGARTFSHVIELFTSQGCSSCPPANANLVKLKNDPDILTLSFSVTYWDYLGWKDSFGRADYTQRQYAYEPPLGKSGPFTPQMVINGRTSAIGNDFTQLKTAIASTAALQGHVIRFEADTVILAKSAVKRPLDIWLVRYETRIIEVPVHRGENSGRTLPHASVVRDLVRLGSWNGQDAALSLPKGPPDLATAILLQEPQGGPVVAAASQDTGL